MSVSNHHPHSSIQQGRKRQWCCTAHCEEHDQLLNIYHEAIHSKVVTLRTRVIATVGDIGKLRTTQEVSSALNKVNEWIYAINEGINAAQTLHDKFCGEIPGKIDAHTTSICTLEHERNAALQVLLELRKKYRTLENDHPSQS
ncbi:hypothetical protein QCA50_019564 [Cerrena zonata]|uniref:Uncharacterized protein n=1 Tax=Cerrena zonata TaxID=2478898 RepID=A0AAW0FAZ1_9APHY